jgi:hypothetical protein
MSTAALALLEGLLKLTAETLAFTEHLKALPGRDHNLMVERLMVRARQEQSWGKPPVLWAFLALIEAAPEIGTSFGKFLTALEPTRLTAAIVPILSDKLWAKAALQAWLTNSECPGPVKRAINASQKAE